MALCHAAVILDVPYKGTAHKLHNGTALFTLLDALQVVAAALGGKVGSNPSGDFVLTGVAAHAQVCSVRSVLLCKTSLAFLCNMAPAL